MPHIPSTLRRFASPQGEARLLAVGLSIVLLAACGRPVAKFAAEVTDDKAPATVRFANASTRAEAYLWDFGDGDTSTYANPTHRYPVSGNYLVTLTATRDGKSAVDSQRVQIFGPVACLVEITTPLGRMVVELSDKTPKHRDNFIKLAEEGYYDGLLFHRVIDGFMVQGGDPDSKGAPAGKPLGSGGPGYQVDAEITPELAHVRGAIAAARTGDAVNPQRRSSGSQFYLVQGRPVSEDELARIERSTGKTYPADLRQAYLEQGGVPFLDHQYTVFGRVVEGLDVIDAIARVAKDGRDRPAEDVPMQVRVIN